MSAKGKGKGKGNGLKLDGDVLKKLNQHDGALDSSYFVQAQMENGRWFKSRILDCRLAKGNFTPILNSFSSFFFSYYRL